MPGWTRPGFQAALIAALFVPWAAGADEPTPFRAGSGRREITPEAPVPLWGYADRHDALSRGTLDPLEARALVIEVGGERLAIVATDLGRGPTPAMLEAIRAGARRVGVDHVLVGGSHTHHGPVLELTDAPGLGRGRFDDAVRYAETLPGRLVEAIEEAVGGLRPARIGTATRSVPLNRNRHDRGPTAPTDPTLAVLRLDDETGAPLALLVNYAAHPVLTDGDLLEFSADYPGYLRRKVESELGAPCLFLQGAAGDLSCHPGPGQHGPRAFGEALADQALDLARSIRSEAPEHPALAVRTESIHVASRLDLGNPLVVLVFGRAFFPELIRNYAREFGEGIDCELTTVLLNDRIGLVGVPGEFFCTHALRLRERSPVSPLFFVGYCNGHALYFPTIEAAARGGYGADPTSAPAAVGSGERLMDAALIGLFRLRGRFAGERP